MSDWRPPVGMTPQAHPRTNAGLPMEGIRDLLDKVDRTKRELDEATNRLLKSAGISVSPAGMTIASSLTVTGDLAVPNGSILNAWLESPIDAASFFATVSNFDPPTSSFGTVVTETLTVPADRSRAIVIANGAWAMKNTTADTATQIHGRVRIAGVAGPTDDEWSEALRRDTGNASYSRTVSGLVAGDTVAVELQCETGADFGADVNNFATVSGVVLWLR